MERQPFLIGYPRETIRLLTTGYINSPDGTRWNISFTPGIFGSWKGFLNCLKGTHSCFQKANNLGWVGFKTLLRLGWNCVKWGCDLNGYESIVKTSWNGSSFIFNKSIKIIQTIPDDISEGCENTTKLFSDTPFGWVSRIIINSFWNCLAVPIIKLLLGTTSLLILPPSWFLSTTIFGIIGRFILGNGLGIISTFGSFTSITLGFLTSIMFLIFGCVSSLFPLIGGTIISSGVALGTIVNRFPKPSDNGTYGLHIVNRSNF